MYPGRHECRAEHASISWPWLYANRLHARIICQSHSHSIAGKLRDFTRSNRELKGKNAELKGRLEGALRDQRRLVMEVGCSSQFCGRSQSMRCVPPTPHSVKPWARLSLALRSAAPPDYSGMLSRHQQQVSTQALH